MRFLSFDRIHIIKYATKKNLLYNPNKGKMKISEGMREARKVEKESDNFFFHPTNFSRIL